MHLHTSVALLMLYNKNVQFYSNCKSLVFTCDRSVNKDTQQYFRNKNTQMLTENVKVHLISQNC